MKKFEWKSVLALALTGVLALGLTACGSSDSKTADAGSAAAADGKAVYRTLDEIKESEGLDRVDMKLADNQIELLQAVEQFIGAVVVRFAFIVSVDDRLGIFLHLVGDRSEFVL